MILAIAGFGLRAFFGAAERSMATVRSVLPECDRFNFALDVDGDTAVRSAVEDAVLFEDIAMGGEVFASFGAEEDA